MSGCQTIKNKTDEIVEKENTKLSQFIGKSSNSLQMELGKPDEDFKNDKGNLEQFIRQQLLLQHLLVS